MADRSEKIVVGGQFMKWNILKKLGEGSFGAVYKVRKTGQEDQLCAMKTEPITEDDSMIKMEVAVLKTFRSSRRPHPHICDYVDSGATSKFRFVVMKLAGPNLADVRRNCPKRRLSEATTIRLGVQCVQSIESLHSIGFIHRDIKPPNYAIGRGDDQRIIYLLDFGLARQFVNKDGLLRPPRQTVGFRGTVRYASLNAHKRRDLGRHDDLWSLLYMLVELQRGRLPWRKLSGKDEVGEMKKRTTADVLLDQMAKEFHEILNELQGLQYKDTPNYGWLCERFTAIMVRQKYSDNAPYDWESGGIAYDSILKAAISKYPYKRQKMEMKKAEKEKKGEEKSVVD